MRYGTINFGIIVKFKREQIAWFSTPDICGVRSSYAKTLWIGDSFTRHSIMALYILFTENYQTGGYNLFVSLPESEYRRCNCDGQFSQIGECGKDPQGNEVNLQHPVKKVVCPFEEIFTGLHSGASIIHHLKRLLPTLCSAKGGLRMIYLQGGARFRSDANRTFRDFILPTIKNIFRNSTEVPSRNRQ